MPSQPEFKPQTCKIPYEGPTRYEILYLIARYNAAHHEVDHIHPTGLTEVDRAAVESLVTLDRERLFKNNPLDRDLDNLLRDIQQVKQINTEKDCSRIDWQRLVHGATSLKGMKFNHEKSGLKGLAEFAGIALNQRQAAAKGDAGKQLAEGTSNTDWRKWYEVMTDASRGAAKQVRKSQSHADFGAKPAQQAQGHGARKDAAVHWKDTEVRNSACTCGICPCGCDFRLHTWMLPPCANGGKLAKDRAKGRSPSPHPQRDAQGNGSRPATPGPAKLQKSNPNNVSIPTRSTPFQIPPFIPQAQARAKTPANQDHHHSNYNAHQHRPRSPGLQPPANHQARPVSPNPPQQIKRNGPPPTQKGTVYQLPVKTYVQSPTKHTVYQQTAKPNVPTSAQDTAYPRPPKSTTPRPKSPAPRQHATPYLPGQLNRPKSNANLRQADPTKDPTNKTMYNKRPRIVTEIKDMRMQKAHDEALRLASEIRKMD